MRLRRWRGELSAHHGRLELRGSHV